MQQDDNKNDLFLKKYKYLYDNKEIILAQNIEKSKDNNLFLSKNFDSKFIICFKDFIMGDCSIEKTDLYNYIEFIKSNSFYGPMFQNIIDEFKKHRKLNIYLRTIPTFSVWKILDYVRNWYFDCEEITNELDKYYNLDRYMITGIDWHSGYYLSKYDLDNYYENLGAFPTTYIIARGDFLENGDFTIFNYCGNEFELEDNYLAVNSNIGDTNEVNIDIDLKKNIYSTIYSSHIKKYAKEF